MKSSAKIQFPKSADGNYDFSMMEEHLLEMLIDFCNRDLVLFGESDPLSRIARKNKEMCRVEIRRRFSD
jgi:hypothetical protein